MGTPVLVRQFYMNTPNTEQRTCGQLSSPSNNWRFWKVIFHHWQVKGLNIPWRDYDLLLFPPWMVVVVVLCIQWQSWCSHYWHLGDQLRWVHGQVQHYSLEQCGEGKISEKSTGESDSIIFPLCSDVAWLATKLHGGLGMRTGQSKVIINVNNLQQYNFIEGCFIYVHIAVISSYRQVSARKT